MRFYNAIFQTLLVFNPRALYVNSRINMESLRPRFSSLKRDILNEEQLDALPNQYFTIKDCNWSKLLIMDVCSYILCV